MSKMENLQEKVQKAQETVDKRKATIARHEKQLVKKIATLEKSSGRTVDVDNIDSYKWDENGKSYEYYWDACDVSRKLDDIEGAKRNLAKAEQTLRNWKQKLTVELEKEEFIQNSLPQVIKDFLEEWKELACKWHVKRYHDFQKFKAEIDKKSKEAYERVGVKNSIPPNKAQREELEEMGLDYNSVKTKKAEFAGVAVLTMDRFRTDEERFAWLDKTLEEDKRAKTVDLLNRITHVVGEIQDATGLSISNVGNLNGVIKGSKADARVETISAGGWNVQCFHYRTLVHKL